MSSPLWQNFRSLWSHIGGLFSIWNDCKPTLANCHLRKQPNFQASRTSAHTVRQRQAHEVVDGDESVKNVEQNKETVRPYDL